MIDVGKQTDNGVDDDNASLLCLNIFNAFVSLLLLLVGLHRGEEEDLLMEETTNIIANP